MERKSTCTVVILGRSSIEGGEGLGRKGQVSQCGEEGRYIESDLGHISFTLWYI
jgi:hypothetical protein